MGKNSGGESRPLMRKGGDNGSSSGYDSSDGTLVAAKKPPAKESTLKKLLLPLYSILLLISATGNSICFKKMTNAMPNYPFFLMQASTVVYIPTFAIVVEIIRRTTGLNEETLNFPQHKFALMALFDVVSGVMTLFGGVYTKGTTQMLLLQGAIPITMISSVLLLRSKYDWMQCIGALVIMSGVFVVLSPKFFSSGSGVSAGTDLLVFNVIFFLANIPQSLSSVYKEVAFKDTENLDIYYTQLWIAVYQLLMGFVVLPVNALPLLGPVRLPLSQLGAALKGGFNCFRGIDSLVSNCYTTTPIPGLKPCDSCAGAWYVVMQYMFFNFHYNLFAILLIKEGSAALLIIIMTLRLPLGNFAFYMPFIMGEAVQPFNPHDISGLLVILLGLVIYRIQRSPESEQSNAPFVITSVVTLGPGVKEPITSQVQRVNLHRKVESIRGHLYTRLGLPPAPNYVPPDDADGHLPEKFLANSPSEQYNQRSALNASLNNSPVFGVSPVARSAPFYVDLLNHKQRNNESDSDEDEDEGGVYVDYSNPRGRPIP
ncbi:hypothetical protein NDN08_007469 [Rhodosorus marinus]|uniref:EamA domain-containing protein n=1 Tax=Rhodosorus marinus TaxID=101924 RepID=A0AAV8UXN0_9RHOD|nr:hypothetical protein NDN08_007469 [Rhodosorus marinus]